VAALLDAWPPPVWNLVTMPFPGSSISWFISFQPPAHRTDIPEDAWWIYNSSLQSSHNGYAHFEANIWNCHGEHVAISRQVFAEFSKKSP
jgi:acyl-CoA thioesterase